MPFEGAVSDGVSDDAVVFGDDVSDPHRSPNRAGESTGSRAGAALDPDFEAVLRECLDGLIGPEVALHEGSDLAQFGMDSLTVVRLMVTLEDTYGVTIPDESISFEIFSAPGALWNLICGLREEPGER